MKYMLLIYDNADTRERFADDPALMGEMEALMAELTESGELLAGVGLADPVQTRSIRPRDGVPVVTDAPLAEAKEHFGGYLLLDCESLERATEIALRWPNARTGALELRPVMGEAGTEM